MDARQVFAGVDRSGGVPPERLGPIRRVVTDSRVVEAGDLFVAVPGTRTDGHRFVEQALAAGAAGVVVAAGSGVAGPKVVEVPDTIRALAMLAANAAGRPADRLVVVGVTGTNGKTTVAHLLDAIVRAFGAAVVRLGTCGDRIADQVRPSSFTTPFPPQLHRRLAEGLRRGARYAVLEVSSHALAQRRVDEVPFRAVGLTNVGRDHLDYHGSPAAYLEAKLDLARRHLSAGGTACALVSGDGAGEAFLRAARRRGASAWAAAVDRPTADVAAEAVVTRRDGIEFSLATPVGRSRVTLPLVGRHNVENALVAAGLALGAGLSFEAVVSGLAGAQPPPGRLEPVAVPGVLGPRVLVDYAHTPDAVATVIAAVRPSVRGRLVVVLGCGGDRDPGKRPQMGRAAAEADRFYATSDNPRGEPPGAIVDAMMEGVPLGRRGRVVREVDRAAAIARALAEAADEDTVLILGKGHETYQEMAGRRLDFDDREHARRALARRGR